MTVVCVASGRSSAGATSVTVGLAMAWSRWDLNPLLIEADPAGGVLGLRFGLASRPSLLSLITEARRSFSVDQLDAHSQSVGGAPSLIGVADPVVAARTVARAGDILGPELERLARPIVIDLGRITSDSSSLGFVDPSCRVLLTTRSTTAEVQAMLFQLRLLRDRNVEPELVVIGRGQNRPDEIASFADVSLAGVLPYDPVVASAFVGGRYRRAQLNRAVLWRSMSALAASCVRDLATVPSSPALPAVTDADPNAGTNEAEAPDAEMPAPVLSAHTITPPRLVPPTPVAVAVAEDAPGAVPTPEAISA